MDPTATQVVTDDELVEAIVCELGRYGLNDPRGIERRPILLSIYARDQVRRSIERCVRKNSCPFNIASDFASLPDSTIEADRSVCVFVAPPPPRAMAR